VIFRTETALWDYLSDRLLGRRWTRLESRGTTRGPGDAFGFFRGETVWLELKVGSPRYKALRPSQQDFANDCLKSGIPIWCCFAHRGRLVWISNLNFDAPERPKFYLGDR
jgi:hypothetical protein